MSEKAVTMGGTGGSARPAASKLRGIFVADSLFLVANHTLRHGHGQEGVASRIP